MSRTGHPRAPQRPVAVFALDFAQGASTGRHAHPFGQLVHAAEGVMRVHTDAGAWVVPPGRAVWIPPALEHEVRMVTSVAMRTVYVVPEVLAGAPDAPCVVDVPPLLRELILEALRRPRPYPLGGADERLFRVLLDNVAFRDVVPLHLPSPRSAHIVALATRLERDPADRRTLAAWARATGTSARTLARSFRRETGLSFGAWRVQMRLLRALELLARGRSVTDVALALRYESTSAFIHAFRRHLGTTPARYATGKRGS
jgi:AraC-like DNA-binding protein/quercetin dioxygenase-like cupin family protein